MAVLRIPVNYTGGHTASSLITHQGSSTSTMCACVYCVSPIDGTVIGITSYSSNLIALPGYVGVTFRTTSGASASKVEHTDGARAGNLEVDVFLVAAGITEADALAGKWSHAAATVFLTNYETLNMGQLIVNKGFLGEFVQKGSFFTTEIKGLNQALQQQVGIVTRPECANDLGDARCGVNMAPFTKTGTLTSVASQTVFTDTARTEAAEYFTNGKFEFTSGNNNGYEFHIDHWNATTKTWTLRTPAPYLPQAGDAYSAKRGCLKRPLEDCTTKFSNRVNFRGFEYMTTYEEQSRLPLA